LRLQAPWQPIIVGAQMSRDEDHLLDWVQVLTGLEPDRVAAARHEVARWSFAHTERELLAPNVDAAVAATLMSEDVAALVDHGAARPSVMRKIRRDQTVWSTFAEMRAAALVLRMASPEAEVRVEQGRTQGAHADFRLLSPSGDGANIEVKAIGLSEDEVLPAASADPQAVGATVRHCPHARHAGRWSPHGEPGLSPRAVQSRRAQCS
jgi:hypothetical protein